MALRHLSGCFELAIANMATHDLRAAADTQRGSATAAADAIGVAAAFFLMKVS